MTEEISPSENPALTELLDRWKREYWVKATGLLKRFRRWGQTESDINAAIAHVIERLRRQNWDAEPDKDPLTELNLKILKKSRNRLGQMCKTERKHSLSPDSKAGAELAYLAAKKTDAQPETMVDAEDHTLASLRLCKSELREDERFAIDQSDLTSQELGEQLGISPEAVRKRLSRARLKLRQCLIQRGVSAEDLRS